RPASCVARAGRAAPPLLRTARLRSGSIRPPPARAALAANCEKSHPECEARAPHCPDQRRLAELAPQPRHVPVDYIRLRGSPPDLVDRVLPGNDAAGLADQDREQIRLAPGELDRATRSRRRA